MANHAEEYFLMHKDVRVCLMELDEEGGIRNVRRNEAAADQDSEIGGAVRKKESIPAGLPAGKGYLEKQICKIE